MAATHDTIIEQGSTWTRVFYCKTSAGVVVDLSGATCQMQFRPTVESSTVLFSASFDIDGPAGKITATVSPADSTAVNVTLLEQGKASEAGVTSKGGLAVYDLELTLPTPTPTIVRLVQGKAVITPEVTRA
jgi:hypothetical protein